MILVIGDLIKDEYIFGKAERLCPEGPVPVVVPESEKETPGGAGLVYKQIIGLGIPENEINRCFGTISYKKRIFVGNHLVCRIDRDAVIKHPLHMYEREIIKRMRKLKPDLLIVSDYGKGSFSESSAKRIMMAAKILEIPVFVDAKHNWPWWDGAYAKFPNQRETENVGTATYIIFKRGAEGCIVYENKKKKIPVPLKQVREVKDVTGAGDIFLAAFSAYWLLKSKDMVECAEYANDVASKSVEHVGTYISLDKLQ